jgi:hypothetical protein
MAKKNDNSVKTIDYRHKGEKRTNIPPAKIANGATYQPGLSLRL